MKFTEYICERGHHLVHEQGEPHMMGETCGQCQIIGMQNKFVFSNSFDDHHGVAVKEQIAFDAGMFPVYTINTEQWEPLIAEPV